ncbi:MAG: hypothetical protein HZA79_14335 [Sphingobacteriales bacterium]|nr:hypothetical protein [Sphingobacteriales bacterium]
MNNLLKLSGILLLVTMEIGCKNNDCKEEMKNIIGHSNKEQFIETEEKELIPRFVFDYLEQKYDGEFRIADAGQVCDCFDDLPPYEIDSSLIGKQIAYSMTDSDLIRPASGKYYLTYAKRKLLIFGTSQNIAYISFLEKESNRLGCKFLLFYFKGNRIIEVHKSSPKFPIADSKEALEYMSAVCEG